MNLNDLQSFVRVADAGSIAAVARSEGVPRSTISRRIGRLEEALGVELSRRAGRSFALTDDGQLLHRLTMGALREVTDAVQALRAASEVPRGRLVVAAPDFARSAMFARLFAAYGEQYPEVEVEVRVDNRVIDLIHDGVDVAIRAHSGPIPGAADLMVRTFDMPPMKFYAGPNYLSERSPPKALDALRTHSLVLHAAMIGRPIPLVAASGETAVVELNPPAFRANDTLMVRALLEAGAGIGALPTFLAAPAVARGALVPVLPAWAWRAGRIAVLWPASRHLAPRVRAFVQLTAQVLAMATSSAL